MTMPHVARAAAPSALLGKSVVLSISESRLSRPVAGGPATNSSAQTQLSVYVSSAGRPFVRSNRTLTTGRRGAETKAIDTAPGGNIGVSTASNVSFSGNAMTVTLAMTSGARRIMVNFDASYSTCSASAITAREGGKNLVIRNRYTGENREVLSTQFSVNSCGIKSGNVFSGE